MLEHRAGDRDIVVLGERAHHAFRRVGNRRQPAREFGQRLGLDLLDQVADDVVEQRDMVVVEHGGAVDEQGRNAAQRLGAFLRRAVLDHLFQLGKQRSGNTHCQPYEMARQIRAGGGFTQI